MALRAISFFLLCLVLPGSGSRLNREKQRAYKQRRQAAKEAAVAHAQAGQMTEADAHVIVESTLEDTFHMTHDEAQQTIANYEKMMNDEQSREIVENFESMMTEDDAKRILTNYEQMMSERNARQALSDYEKLMSQGQTRQVINQYQKQHQQRDSQRISKVEMSDHEANQITESVLENQLHMTHAEARHAIDNYERLMSDENTRKIIQNFESMMTEDDARRIISNYEKMMSEGRNRHVISNYAQMMSKGNARQVIKDYKKTKPQPKPQPQVMHMSHATHGSNDATAHSKMPAVAGSLLEQQQQVSQQAVKILTEYQQDMSEDDARQIISNVVRSLDL